MKLITGARISAVALLGPEQWAGGGPVGLCQTHSRVLKTFRARSPGS